MKSLRFAAPTLVALTLGAAVAVIAQGPPPPGAGAPAARGPGRPDEPPKNLQVLPKDLTRRQVIDIMRGFTAALDVECTFCHAAKDPKDFSTIDFASDEKDEKKTARLMIGMVKVINSQYIEKIAMPGDNVEVSCATCHRGHTEPQTLEQALTRPLAQGGAAAALETYGELRAKYYGRAAFDFGPDSLAAIGGNLARAQKFADAIALLEFNARQFPDSQRTLAVLADVQAASGDRAAAIATLEKLLRVAPQDERAQHRLEELRQPEVKK